jgi:hypothetical protein
MGVLGSVFEFDQAADAIGRQLPAGLRVGILGGRVLDQFGMELCRALGQELAALRDAVVITGGVAGAGETVAAAYVEACQKVSSSGHLFHLLPEGSRPPGSGTTLFAGGTMAERRQVLGRLAPVYVAVGGGIGTLDEIQIARTHGAAVLAVAASGGAAAKAWSAPARPPALSGEQWGQLADSSLGPSRMAAAVARILGILARAAESAP